MSYPCHYNGNEHIGRPSDELILIEGAGDFYARDLWFRRWAGIGKPGTWTVDMILSPDQREFVDLPRPTQVCGVMDDFGNLVRVQR